MRATLHICMSVATAVLLFASLAAASTPLPHVRPSPSDRKFHSVAVENLITNFTGRMADTDLATLFENCYPNTLDTTVYSYTPSTPSSPPSSFVITGDIPAQWFRDSSNQLLPYITLLQEDAQLQDLVCGLILRHAHDVTHDPFANAFNFNASGAGHQDDTRKPKMTPEVFEGKYELDSLAAVMKLASAYYNVTQDASCFLQNSDWINGMNILVNAITSMQAPADDPSTSPYLFQRVADVPTETLGLDGMGPPTAMTGMSRSAFRPSDDATTYPYLIPAQAMAVVELNNLANMIHSYSAKHTTSNIRLSKTLRAQLKQLTQLSKRASSLANQIDAGIQAFALIDSTLHGPIYAYEVDGYGGQNLMDDANIPSLLSLPYLGYVGVNDGRYQNTRQYIWSNKQPYFWTGTAGAGIGGPHVGTFYVWPMSIIMYAMTSTSDSEITWALETLKNSSAGTGFLHESFNRNDATDFTRPWFAWVNGLFGELIIKLSVERPYLIFKQ